MLASKHGHQGVAKYLIDKGVNINERDNSYFKKNALHYGYYIFLKIQLFQTLLISFF